MKTPGAGAQNPKRSGAGEMQAERLVSKESVYRRQTVHIFSFPPYIWDYNPGKITQQQLSMN